MDVIFAVTLSLFSIGMNSPEGKQIEEDVYKRQDQHPRCGAVLQLADKEQTADCRRNVDRP